MCGLSIDADSNCPIFPGYQGVLKGNLAIVILSFEGERYFWVNLKTERFFIMTKLSSTEAIAVLTQSLVSSWKRTMAASTSATISLVGIFPGVGANYVQT